MGVWTVARYYGSVDCRTLLWECGLSHVTMGVWTVSCYYGSVDCHMLLWECGLSHVTMGVWTVARYYGNLKSSCLCARKSSGSGRTSLCSLVCEEDVVGVAGRATNSGVRAAVLCEDGKVQLFQVDTAQLDKKTVTTAMTVTPSSTIQFVSTAEKVCTVSVVSGALIRIGPCN